MIIRISRYLLLIIMVIVSAHFLPKLYWMKFEKSISTPFIGYSPIINDFVKMNVNTMNVGKSDVNWSDTKNNIYDRNQYDSIMPFQNYRQLAALNKMPDSIGSKELNLDSVRLNNFTFRIRPSDIDFEKIPLFSLLESKSGRIKLEMPDDFFRINERIEFIDSKTNTINEDKSKRFTEAMLKAGFSFPSKLIAGNPTTRKPFDEGYFILDSNEKLFQLKMEKGNPFCVRIEVPGNIDIAHIAVIEMNLREFYAYLVTGDNQIYLLCYDDYKFIRLPVDNYNYKKDVFYIQGDLYYRTISVIRYDNIDVVVADRGYQVIDKYSEKWTGKHESPAGIFSAYLFPFSINYFDKNSSFVDTYLKLSDSSAILLMILSTIAAVFLIKYRKQSLKKSIPDLILVLITGIYGLIAITAFRDVE
ncbi:MAG: DUF4857 domain-containing protein [Ignavibacteriaceae bacterium]